MLLIEKSIRELEKEVTSLMKLGEQHEKAQGAMAAILWILGQGSKPSTIYRPTEMEGKTAK